MSLACFKIQGGSSAWDSDEDVEDILDIPVISCDTLEMTDTMTTVHKKKEENSTEVLFVCVGLQWTCSDFVELRNSQNLSHLEDTFTVCVKDE